MKQTYIRQISQLDLNSPILFAGLPGIGDIGRAIAKFIIEHTRSQLFAELYSPTFPDYVFINKLGVCYLPRYEFYASPFRKDLVILTGNAQPALNDVPSHYEICGSALEFAVKLGCSSVVTASGAPSSEPTRDIYVAGTSKKQVDKCIENGALAYTGGKIFGSSGLLLGLGEKLGLKGVCLLGSTSGMTVDHETAFRVYKILKRIIGTNI